MLNDAADPCSNFYDFACGKWSESNSKIAPSFNTLQKHVNQEIQSEFHNSAWSILMLYKHNVRTPCYTNFGFQIQIKFFFYEANYLLCGSKSAG